MISFLWTDAGAPITPDRINQPTHNVRVLLEVCLRIVAKNPLSKIQYLLRVGYNKRCGPSRATGAWKVRRFELDDKGFFVLYKAYFSMQKWAHMLIAARTAQPYRHPKLKLLLEISGQNTTISLFIFSYYIDIKGLKWWPFYIIMKLWNDKGYN